ncbi:GNAT family N-acetyltransferase [Roseibium sp. CAU 1637]|uniref:GNAT family N-acetyltransferase n=2 Tax=Stappiaceae TaxID=2821832 RepID=A0A939EJN5_9HYPH|nr:GNAT family N-acetyltransferase [Roseibium limicola]
MISLSLNGYTDIPNEKVAYVVTYLEMLEPPKVAAKPRGDITMERWDEVDIAAYRSLYREIGAEWLWFSRLQLSSEKLHTILDAPVTEIYSPVRDGRRLGILEINTAVDGEIEISFFGLVPDAIGDGLGRWLMMTGLEMAWSRPGIERVWLHTCTGDSPQAVHFYQACGFKPYKRAIEVVDDPRNDGLFSTETARHVPYLGV